MSLSDTKVVMTREGFDIDHVNTEGLVLRVLGGARIDSAGFHSVQNASLTLTASDKSYVEMSDAGVVSANVSGFTSGATFLYEVETDADSIIGIKDWRYNPDVNAALGVQAGFAIFPTDIKQTTGIPVVPAEVAGNFNLSLAANVLLLQGEICDNETETSECNFQFVLPPEYSAGGAITVTVPCALIATAAGNDDGTSSVDLECFKSDGAGAVGSDICATAAQLFAAMDTWYEKAFTVTPTGLVAGDVLNFVLTSLITDDEAGGGTLRFTAEPIQISVVRVG